MNLSTADLKTLADLQLKLQRVQEEKARLKEMLSQMMKNECKVKLVFQMHNEDIYEHNQALKVLQEATVNAFVLGDVALIQQGSAPAQPVKPCCTSFAFPFDMIAGMRILSAILEEKNIEERGYQKETEELLKKLIPSPIQPCTNEHL